GPYMFDPETFNTVICINMLEHTKHPQKIIENAFKILNSGGKLLLSVPFRADIHDFPNDYWRFTDQGLRLLCEEAGFKTEELEVYYPGEDGTKDRIYYKGVFTKP
ncbi:MAG: methyltransferase domain-containing protein, partial [Candidatus Hermodarchaeota archaeon]